MSTTLPSAPTKTNCDATSDDPKLALTVDLADAIDTVADLIAALGGLAQMAVGNGLTTETMGAGVADKLHANIPTTAKTAAYTVLAADRGKLIDCTSGTFSLTFTASATLGDGWFCYVRNSGSGIITLDPNSTELIDGASTVTLAAGESCAVQCTGTALKTIGKTVSGGGISGETTYNTNTTLSISTDHTKLIRCTVASVVYTFPAATGNEGKYWWITNATSTDTAVRLVCNGAESIGGATGATIYIPAYTTIGFVSDNSNWLVFSYTGLPTSTTTVAKLFQSSEQTLAANALITVAHGLGIKPKKFNAILICKTADSGYSVDDETPAVTSNGTSTSIEAISVDATNIYYAQDDTFFVVHKTAFTTGAITLSSWKMILRAEVA